MSGYHPWEGGKRLRREERGLPPPGPPHKHPRSVIPPMHPAAIVLAMAAITMGLLWLRG